MEGHRAAQKMNLFKVQFNDFSYLSSIALDSFQFFISSYHGLRTPNEGINQRYLKNWADVADKICFGHT